MRSYLHDLIDWLLSFPLPVAEPPTDMDEALAKMDACQQKCNHPTECLITMCCQCGAVLETGVDQALDNGLVFLADASNRTSVTHWDA